MQTSSAWSCGPSSPSPWRWLESGTPGSLYTLILVTSAGLLIPLLVAFPDVPVESGSREIVCKICSRWKMGPGRTMLPFNQKRGAGIGERLCHVITLLPTLILYKDTKVNPNDANRRGISRDLYSEQKPPTRSTTLISTYIAPMMR
jgi:hypothetical protein